MFVYLVLFYFGLQTQKITYFEFFEDFLKLDFAFKFVGSLDPLIQQ